MRRNPVLERLRTGGVAVGTFAIELSSPALARVAATAGAEFIALDQEHSGFGSETVRSFLAGARAADIVPLIRVAGKHSEPLSLALDLGALGVIVPFIESAEEAAAAVSSLKYPPLGRRGFGLLHLDEHDGDVGRYMAAANDRTMVVVQIESRSGLEDVERIASVEGVDVLWIGQFDLTASLGIPGQFDSPVWKEALDRVVSACRAAGKAAAMAAETPADVGPLLDRGFCCISFGHDLTLFRRGLAEGVAAVREARGAPQ